MSVITAYTQIENLDGALTELKSKLGDEAFSFIYFVTSRSDINEVAAGMETTFANQGKVFGCLSFAEISDTAIRDKSITVMGIGAEAILDCHIELIDLSCTKNADPSAAVEGIKTHYGEQELIDEYERYAGLILIATDHGGQENLLYSLGNLLANQVVGGTAGLLDIESPVVFWQGQALPNTAILAMLKAKNSFITLKTQAVEKASEQVARITESGTTERILSQINDRPAKQELLSILGLKDQDHQIDDVMKKHHLAMNIDGDFYTRSFDTHDGDSLSTLADIAPLSELYVVRNCENIVDLTKQALAEKLAGAIPQAALFVDCTHRVLFLREHQLEEAYGKCFTAFPHIGFGCGGEAFIGHLNNTFVGLMIL